MQTNNLKKYNHTIYASYLGYITQAIVNNLAPLLFLIFQKQFNLTLVQITSITTLNFGVQLLVDLLSAKFINYIGYRVCIVIAHIFSALGLIGLAVFPYIFTDYYIGIVCAVVLYAIGGGIIEVLISPIVEACPSENKAKAMSLLHSFYCWGTVSVVLISTLFLYCFGQESWLFLAVGWSILPIANAMWFAKVPIKQLPEETKENKLKSLFKNNIFWLYLILMIAAGAAEQSMSQWASAFAEKSLNIPKAIGDLAGPCFFSILMGISRTFFGKFGEKIDLRNYMIGSAVLCFLSYIIIVISSNFILSFIGCGLCGLSVGIMWPGVFSLASDKITKGGTTMFALLALAGDVGCSCGPTMVGIVASTFGGQLKYGLAVATVFAAIIFVGMIICKKHTSALYELNKN